MGSAQPHGRASSTERGIPVLGVALAAGTANVIMQLSWPAVGHGVVESPVESGRIFDHPVKRTRTTLSYLAVALRGTEADRAVYRRAVDRVHAQVVSGPGSPVAYHAFDRRLQTWVAACLYRGFEDVYEAFIGPLDAATRQAFYVHAAPLGTTLQVREQDWPADREAFERYWQDGLEEVHVDATVRAYLHDLVDLRFVAGPARVVAAPLHRWVTTGFLDPVFRHELGLRWTRADQRRFTRWCRRIGAVVVRLPRPAREFPFNLLLWDVRRRVRRGQPLV